MAQELNLAWLDGWDMAKKDNGKPRSSDDDASLTGPGIGR